MTRICFGFTIVFLGVSFVFTHILLYLKSPQNRQLTWIFVDYLQMISFCANLHEYIYDLPPNIQVAVQLLKPFTSLELEVFGNKITPEAFIFYILILWIGIQFLLLFLRTTLIWLNQKSFRKTINLLDLILWQSGYRLTSIFYFPLSILAFSLLSKQERTGMELIEALAILGFLFLDIVLRIELLTRAPRVKA